MPVAKRKTTKRKLTSKARPLGRSRRSVVGTKRVAAIRFAKAGWDLFAPKALKKWAWMVKGIASAGVVIAIAYSMNQMNPFKVSNERGPAATNMTELQKEFVKVAAFPLDQRIDYWSNKLQMQPGWMKEFQIQAGIDQPTISDQAPLVPEKFNCTTFVETVVALSRSKMPEQYYKNLIAIRYNDSKTDFFGRNHFPEADWIPNNTTAGILRDVTRIVGLAFNVAADTQTKTIDRGKWFDSKIAQGQVNRKLASAVDSNWREPIAVELPYLKTKDLYGKLDHIQNATVANLVRQSKPRQPVLISHQGFVIQKDGVTYFRHSTPQGEIKTNKMAEYLKSVTDHSPKSWPMVGLNFNQVLE